MSTGHMPTPPDHLTTQAANADVKGQTVPSSASAQPAKSNAAPPATAATTPAQGEVPAAPQLPLNEELAKLFEDQLGTIAQKMVYNCQLLFGVGGMGTDPVSAREALMVIAGALRSRNLAPGVYALVNLGDPQIVQVNDRTFPFRFSEQATGLLEGILLDTTAKAYKTDPERAKQAHTLLSSLFITANEELQKQLKVIPMMSQAPAMGNDFIVLTGTQAGTQAIQDAPALHAPRSTDKE